jgi:hypothetical protein
VTKDKQFGGKSQEARCGEAKKKKIKIEKKKWR